MTNQHSRASVRRAVIAVTLSGTAAIGCHKSNNAPDRQDDATQGGAAEQPAATTSATPVEAPTPSTLPRVNMPAAPERAVDMPLRIENAVLPTEGGEAAPIRPLAPRPGIEDPDQEPSQPDEPNAGQPDTGNATSEPSLGDGEEFDPDVVEPRVDPDITACSNVADGVCPLECTRQNDRDCCEVVGRGGVCSFDEQRGCRCAVIGPFNPPERAERVG